VGIAMAAFLSKRNFYYGWIMVGLAMVSMAFWFGFRTSFSVFFATLVDHFHWSRAEAAGVQSLAMIVYMVMAPTVGTLVDRIGPRRVIIPGTLLLALGLILCTRIETLGEFYLYFGLIAAIGVTGLSITAFTVILAHWFLRYRGRAYGLAAVGIGIGSFAFVPLLQFFISSRGWAYAFFIFALLVLLIPLPLNLFLLKHKPAEVGRLPDGDFPFPSGEASAPRKEEGVKETSSPVPPPGPELGEVIRTGRFWALLFFPASTALGIYVIIVHTVKYLVDQRVDPMWAASLFAASAAISAAFRFLWGWLSDWMGREMTFTLGSFLFSTGVLLLLLFQYFPSPLLLYLFVVIFGVGWGATSPMFMAVSADLYQGKNFGLIYGLVEAMVGIGAALGSWGAGWIFDRTQNYLWAFILTIFLNQVSVALVWIIAPRKVRPIRAGR
jgi:MFS family permease